MAISLSIGIRERVLMIHDGSWPHQFIKDKQIMSASNPYTIATDRINPFSRVMNKYRQWRHKNEDEEEHVPKIWEELPRADRTGESSGSAIGKRTECVHC